MEIEQSKVMHQVVPVSVARYVRKLFGKYCDYLYTENYIIVCLYYCIYLFQEVRKIFSKDVQARNVMKDLDSK